MYIVYLGNGGLQNLQLEDIQTNLFQEDIFYKTKLFNSTFALKSVYKEL